MDQIFTTIQKLEIHPVVDHFTIALLTVAVLTDLVASMAPSRMWLRYMALTLTVLGAMAAGASFATGDMEADRIWNALGAPAQAILKRHAMLGEYMAIAFGALAVWRILLQSFTFMSGSRTVYLILAIVCLGTIFYVGHLGGSLVYGYGAGTALMASEPIPDKGTASPTVTPAPPAALPTVSVPTPTPSPAPSVAAPAAAASSSPAPSSGAVSPSPSPASGATL